MSVKIFGTKKCNDKEGFEVVSEPFMEDGIPHVKMEKVCDR